MKIIIAGSRTLGTWEQVENAVINSTWQDEFDEEVSGGAAGVDSMGEFYARANNIPVKRFPAFWNVYGKSAGFRRNEQMAEYADALIAIWDGTSRGTKHMIDIMQKLNKPVYVEVIQSGL